MRFFFFKLVFSATFFCTIRLPSRKPVIILWVFPSIPFSTLTSNHSYAYCLVTNQISISFQSLYYLTSKHYVTLLLFPSLDLLFSCFLWPSTFWFLSYLSCHFFFLLSPHSSSFHLLLFLFLLCPYSSACLSTSVSILCRTTISQKTSYKNLDQEKIVPISLFLLINEPRKRKWSNISRIILEPKTKTSWLRI